MAGLISNLIIVLVFAITLGKCDFVQKPAEETSSPEMTNLEVSGLNEEQITRVFLQNPKSSPRKRWLKTDSVLYIPDTTNLGLNEEHVNLFQTLTQVSEIANMVMGLLDNIFVPSPDAIDLEDKLKSTHLLKCFSEVSATQVSEILKIFLVFLTGETNLKKENKFAYDKLLNQVTKIVALEQKIRQLTSENERLTSEPPNCNPKLFSKCQCTSPAKYSPEGCSLQNWLSVFSEQCSHTFN